MVGNLEPLSLMVLQHRERRYCTGLKFRMPEEDRKGLISIIHVEAEEQVVEHKQEGQ